MERDWSRKIFLMEEQRERSLESIPKWKAEYRFATDMSFTSSEESRAQRTDLPPQKHTKPSPTTHWVWGSRPLLAYSCPWCSCSLNSRLLTQVKCFEGRPLCLPHNPYYLDIIFIYFMQMNTEEKFLQQWHVYCHYSFHWVYLVLC